MVPSRIPTGTATVVLVLLVAGAAVTSSVAWGGGAWGAPPVSTSVPGPQRGWENVTPAVSPPAVGGGMMAYSPNLDEFVLFGGSTGVATNTTWVLRLNGGGWTQLHPAVSPPVRADGMFVYDQSAAAFLLFGGWFQTPTGAYLRRGDTWAFYAQNDTWLPLHPARSPSPRSDSAVACDPADDVTLLVGGFNGTAYLGDEWSFTFANESWWPLSSRSEPSRRADGRMAYDAGTNAFYLYGGNDYSGPHCTCPPLGASWTYAWRTHTWTQLFPTVTPGALDYAVLAADAKSGVILMSGGYGASTVLGDTWAFNTTQLEWAQVTASVSPPPRRAAVGGYESVDNRFVVFSGGDGPLGRDDTWSLAYPPDLQVSVAASATAVSPGAKVHFTADVIGGTGFVASTSWSFGDGSTANGTNASHVFRSPGVYTVRFRATDDNGPGSSASLQIVVRTPGPPWAALAAAGGIPAFLPAGGGVPWARRVRVGQGGTDRDPRSGTGGP